LYRQPTAHQPCLFRRYNNLLSSRNDQSTTQPTDTSNDEEPIFVVGDEGSDKTQNTEAEQTRQEKDPDLKRIGQSSSNQEESSESQSVTVDDPDALGRGKTKIMSDWSDGHTSTGDVADIDECGLSWSSKDPKM
jgi:hypothetical protein